MKWFTGNYTEAVTRSKSNNAILVIYVKGEDEMSYNLTKLIEAERVRTKLESDDFVPITIPVDSEAFEELVSMQQTLVPVPVPSLLFFQESSKPLCIITSEVAGIEDLEEKIDSVLVAAGKNLLLSGTPSMLEIEFVEQECSEIRKIAGNDEGQPNGASEAAPYSCTKKNSTPTTALATLNRAATSAATAAARLTQIACIPEQRIKPDGAAIPWIIPSNPSNPSNPINPTNPAIDSEERLAKVQRKIEEKRQEQQQERALAEEREENFEESKEHKNDERMTKKQQKEEDVSCKLEIPVVLERKRENEREREHEHEQDQVQKEARTPRKPDDKMLLQELETLKKQHQEALRLELERRKRAAMQHELELKILKENIRREREMAAAERERIRAQIAVELAEHEYARRMLQPPVAAAYIQWPNEISLEFRLPGGINRTKIFNRDITLYTVREYVTNELLNADVNATSAAAHAPAPAPPVHSFTFATMYPRHEFVMEDEQKTLAELDLVSNAIILVLSHEKSNRVVRHGGFIKMLTIAFWAVITPAAKAFDYVHQIGLHGFRQRVSARLQRIGLMRTTPEITVGPPNELQPQRGLNMFIHLTNATNTQQQQQPQQQQQQTMTKQATATTTTSQTAATVDALPVTNSNPSEMTSASVAASEASKRIFCCETTLQRNNLNNTACVKKDTITCNVNIAEKH